MFCLLKSTFKGKHMSIETNYRHSNLKFFWPSEQKACSLPERILNSKADADEVATMLALPSNVSLLKKLGGTINASLTGVNKGRPQAEWNNIDVARCLGLDHSKGRDYVFAADDHLVAVIGYLANHTHYHRNPTIAVMVCHSPLHDEGGTYPSYIRYSTGHRHGKTIFMDARFVPGYFRSPGVGLNDDTRGLVFYAGEESPARRLPSDEERNRLIDAACEGTARELFTDMMTFQKNMCGRYSLNPAACVVLQDVEAAEGKEARTELEERYFPKPVAAPAKVVEPVVAAAPAAKPLYESWNDPREWLELYADICRRRGLPMPHDDKALARFAMVEAVEGLAARQELEKLYPAPAAAAAVPAREAVAAVRASAIPPPPADVTDEELPLEPPRRSFCPPAVDPDKEEHDELTPYEAAELKRLQDSMKNLSAAKQMAREPYAKPEPTLQMRFKCPPPPTEGMDAIMEKKQPPTQEEIDAAALKKQRESEIDELNQIILENPYLIAGIDPLTPKQMRDRMQALNEACTSLEEGAEEPNGRSPEGYQPWQWAF